MITASYKLLGKRDALIAEGNVKGWSITSALKNLRIELHDRRLKVKAEGKRDPMVNWDMMEIYVSKRPGKLPIKKGRSVRVKDVK